MNHSLPAYNPTALMYPLASQRDCRQFQKTRYSIFEKKYSLASCKTEVELDSARASQPTEVPRRFEYKNLGLQLQGSMMSSVVLSQSTSALNQQGPPLNSLRLTTRNRDLKHRSSETTIGGDNKPVVMLRSRIFDQSFSKNSLSKMTKSTIDLKHTQSFRPSVVVSTTSLKPVETVCRIYSDPVEPYCFNILSHMKTHAKVNKSALNPLKHQEKVNKRMRFIIFNWLLESSQKFKFKPRTIFMAGNIMDRFLSAKKIVKDKFQLIGVTCLFIAAKYEEVRPPSTQHMGFLLDELHGASDILAMEAEILIALDFNLHSTLPVDMAEMLLKVSGLKDKDLSDLVYEVLNIFACHYHVDRFEPTKLAAFALTYAAKLSRKHPRSFGEDWWVSEHEFGRLSSKLRSIVLTAHSFKLDGIQKVNKQLNTTFFKP